MRPGRALPAGRAGPGRAPPRIYPEGDIPLDQLDGLAEQIEVQTRHYDIREEHVEVALALVKPEGFTEELDEHGRKIYTAEISYRTEHEPLLLSWSQMQEKNRRKLGFHYSPLDFDSNPEKDFFIRLLEHLNVKLWEVEDIYFTGGLTDPAKTDFYVEYRGEDGRWHRYTPDFIIRKKPAKATDPPGSGRVLIVEVKGANRRGDAVDGEKGLKALAVREWEQLNTDRLKYEMIFTATDEVPLNSMSSVLKFAEAQELLLPIDIDRAKLAEFCGKWKIQTLEVFGSVLRFDFRNDSDVDFLVTFKPGARWGWTEDFAMREELRALVGREVDLVSRPGVERSANWIRRRSILSSARALYVS